jgi:NAD(P)-dependent dehydrogenase (short-subunit alcohol dehydrogenase family)
VRLANKTVLITGGNSGIGFAAAKLFIAEGAKVAIVGRDQATLDQAAQALGPNALAIQADAVEQDSIERAVAAAVKAFGPLDVVFANAGVGGPTPVGGTSAAAFDRILTINLTGPFLTVQAAAPHLKSGASIILTGSVIGVLGMAAYSAYAATKEGLKAMSKSLASELAPEGRARQSGYAWRDADADLGPRRWRAAGCFRRGRRRSGDAYRQGDAARANERSR